jgi:hypothetical protein
MAQYTPPAQQGGGGRGGAGAGAGAGGGGGRGYQGRGGPQPPGRPMGAWQPSAPTSSLQQAAYGRQPQQPQQPAAYHHQQQQQQPQQHHHNQHLQHPNQHHMPPAFHVNAPHHYNPYVQQPYPARQAGPGQWQAAYTPPGGVYYPPTQALPVPAAGTPVVPVVVPPKPREKKPLIITVRKNDANHLESQKKAVYVCVCVIWLLSVNIF